jgi:hypothetical protein
VAAQCTIDLLALYDRTLADSILCEIPPLHTPPSPRLFADAVLKFVEWVRAGHRVLVHGHSSIGRVGLFLACALKALGVRDAVALIAREVHGALEGGGEIAFVDAFDPSARWDD